MGESSGRNTGLGGRKGTKMAYIPGSGNRSGALIVPRCYRQEGFLSDYQELLRAKAYDQCLHAFPRALGSICRNGLLDWQKVRIAAF